jgi:hypothetical protein
LQVTVFPFIHACFANINALIELPGIKILVSLSDAGTLLIGIFGLLRTRRKADSLISKKCGIMAQTPQGSESDTGGDCPAGLLACFNPQWPSLIFAVA